MLSVPYNSVLYLQKQGILWKIKLSTCTLLWENKPLFYTYKLNFPERKCTEGAKSAANQQIAFFDGNKVSN